MIHAYFVQVLKKTDFIFFLNESLKNQNKKISYREVYIIIL